MANPKILMTAQNFGFGPTSKAGSIASYIKLLVGNIQIDFCGEGIAYDLGLSKKEVFDNVLKTGTNKEMNNLIKGYDILISVMEPNSIILSKNNNINKIYVDSLFWFWNWSSLDLNNVRCLREKLERPENDEILEEILSQHPHNRQFFGHLFANKSYIQTYPFSNFRPELTNKDIGEVEVVGPIIDDKYKKETKKDTILISFCGQKNPLVNFKDSIDYCNFCLNILEDGLINFKKKFSGIKILAVGHPKIINYLKYHHSKKLKISFKHLKHSEYYKTFNSSLLIIGPPSITTMYESLVYEKPYIMLPEQHDGHFSNYLRITKQVRTDGKDEVSEVYPGFMLTPFFKELRNLEEENVSKLYLAIRRCQKDNHLLSHISTIYSRALGKMKDESSFRKLFLKQRDGISSIEKIGENGALAIAKELIV